MKRLHQFLMVSGVAGAITLLVSPAFAQDQAPPPGRGNFDPEQFRQRMMDRYREQLEVKSEDEWKVIQTRIEKVTEARRDVGGPGMFGRGGGRRGGGPGGPGGDQAGGRGRFGGEPNPDQEALQKALEAKAPADEIKAKLAKYREGRKAKEAKLATAQDDLRKVLSVRQEASAVLAGLLQ